MRAAMDKPSAVDTTTPRRRKLQIAFDVLLAVSLGVLYATMVVALKPFERGFWCNDETIRYPRRPDSVTITMLVVFTTVITPLLFVIVECVTSWRGRSRTVSWLSWYRAAACSSVVLFGFFWIGLMTTLIVTEVGKLTIGRLRPHFMDVCRPVLNTTDCSSLGYIEDYKCSNVSHPRLVVEARKSFPSGHSSMAGFMAVYLAYYIHCRLRTGYSQLVRLLVQLTLCSLAVYTGLSRVSDNMHHWSDVLAGALIGVLVALWTIIFLKKSVSLGHKEQLRSTAHAENGNKSLLTDNTADKLHIQLSV
jgi:phosphatidate phosphatase